jgi:hypothetical protein
VHTLENIVSKVIIYNTGAAKVFQTSVIHNYRELVYQFYNVNTQNYYIQASGGDPMQTWIQFAPEHYVIEEPYFYTSKFRLLPDKYAFLISQYQQP